MSERIVRRLRRQAAACEQLGSSLYAELIGRTAELIALTGHHGRPVHWLT